MNTATILRRRAELYRRIELQIKDPIAIEAICEVVSELEMAAEEMERRQNIAARAREIWLEHGRPRNRDVEFWLAAEREVGCQRRR